MNRVFPANLPNKQYQLLFTQDSGESKEGEKHMLGHLQNSICVYGGVTTLTLTLLSPTEIVNYEFDTKDLICLGISSVVGVWYVLKKVE